MNKENILKELSFKAVRSSGAGGQHVNKVSSKIELSFDLDASNAFSDEEKAILRSNLSPRLTKNNLLLLTCDVSRSQHRNRELVIQRFFELIAKGLIIPKKRKTTKPTKASVQKKMQDKVKQSRKKALRKKPPLE